MREFIITAPDAGRRIDRWLQKQAPGLTAGLAQKYFRQKDIKRNGHPAHREDVLEAGDVVRAYLPEELFQAVEKPDALLSRFRWRLDILWEDEGVLLIDKRPGVLVHPDDREKVDTLVTHVRAYLYQKGAYDPRADGFAPAPVNRIDRFTAGIVVFARTEAALKALTAAMDRGEVAKRYLCIALGAPRPGKGTFDNYILKNTRRVTVLDRPAEGAQRAVTRYRTLAEKDGLALLECALETGRTHQIRAQLAHAGHPLLGDGQYGDARRNQRWNAHQQALCAYRLDFHVSPEDPVLGALAGKRFQVKRVAFAETWFPEIALDALPPWEDRGRDGGPHRRPGTDAGHARPNESAARRRRGRNGT